uniref:Uncharacterized protein TCIL3000_3_2610 n=1 Tax=Trypanosoma congolense (strain IL3000) TaxID=1068625 RepID=G0UKC3_TRYCI|nr:unnamed protein product [Trypanosoma congolense IL3000]
MVLLYFVTKSCRLGHQKSCVVFLICYYFLLFIRSVYIYLFIFLLPAGHRTNIFPFHHGQLWSNTFYPLLLLNCCAAPLCLFCVRSVWCDSFLLSFYLSLGIVPYHKPHKTSFLPSSSHLFFPFDFSHLFLQHLMCFFFFLFVFFPLLFLNAS